MKDLLTGPKAGPVEMTAGKTLGLPSPERWDEKGPWGNEVDDVDNRKK